MKKIFLYLSFVLHLFSSNAFVVEATGDVIVARIVNKKLENIKIEIKNFSEEKLEISKKILSTNAYKKALKNSQDPKNKNHKKAKKFLERDDIKSAVRIFEESKPVEIYEKDIVILGDKSFAKLNINNTIIYLGNNSRFKIFSFKEFIKIQLTNGICETNTKNAVFLKSRVAVAKINGVAVLKIDTMKDLFANLKGEVNFLNTVAKIKLESGFFTTINLLKQEKAPLPYNGQSNFTNQKTKPIIKDKTIKGDFQWNGL